MKKLHKKAAFVVPFLGTQPYLKGIDFWKNFITDRITAAIISEKERKKEQADPDEAYKKALSVFNYYGIDGKNPSIQEATSKHLTVQVPIIGGWMLRACAVNSAYLLGLTQKGNNLPGRAAVECIRCEPYAVFMYRKGKVIEKLDRLDLNTFKPRGGKTGIIKIREAIGPPAEFEFDLIYNENTISDQHIEEILYQMQFTALGAFRERFGKFQYIK